MAAFATHTRRIVTEEKRVKCARAIAKTGRFICFLLFCAASVYGGTAVDTSGHKIHVPDHDFRVVSLSPGGTEILFELGVHEELVGVSDFCNHPHDFVSSKPKMGGFSTPNLERIQSVSPHVILLNTVVPISIKKQFDRLGTQVFVTEPKSFSELLDMIVQLGRLFNREAEAQALITEMKNEAGEVARHVETKSVAPVRTFIEIWYDPYYGAGKNTLAGDIVRLAGGKVVPESSTPYPRINEEILLTLNPEAIILGHQIDAATFLEIHSNLVRIYAIRNNKIFTPDPDVFLRPSPRVVNALKEIARFLHPEAF